ncbi:hypothetical protein NQ317_019194 [Molorchus minor]|uniref:Ferric-chelate reductase 1 n=1 Tax=Molorchus minor TaxID=1323400 RepID=A0ABQ9IVI1_9CUCU|nr:hypothetical protein NQ317_019194 [Molorchus minor]
MMPQHGDVEAQRGNTRIPLAINRQGDDVSVSVGSPLGMRFQGILLQARTISGDILGQFELPEGLEAPYCSFATIAQSYNKFWLEVLSDPVQLSKRAIDTATSNFNLLPVRTTTRPPSFIPEIPKESSTDFDPFYDGCTHTKLCFGAPVNCVLSKNCQAVVAITVTGDAYDFELKAEDPAAWVGVGLSDDNKMGDDSIIECVKRGNKAAAYMSWTSNSPYSAVRLRNPQLGIQLLNSSIVDGAIYCKVRRDVVTQVNGVTFDLINEKYNLLIAAGASANETSVLYHGITFLASAKTLALSDVSTVAAASKLLIRLHGSFMLAAWIGTASIGIFLARYYRQTWKGSTLMGKDLWFAWHRIFMVLTWALSIVASVLIFVELKQWSKENNPHAILGTITTILCFFQPIGAYFRPHPGTPKRSIFNWAHWFIGNSAHIIGIVTIFFSLKLTKAELPEFVEWILVAFVVVHVISHLLLSLMGCISEKSPDKIITSFPMKDLVASGRNSAYPDPNADAPVSIKKRNK